MQHLLAWPSLVHRREQVVAAKLDVLQRCITVLDYVFWLNLGKLCRLARLIMAQVANVTLDASCTWAVLYSVETALGGQRSR